MSDQLIGAFITLIATNDIRYDGVLFTVNTTDSKIVLRDVRIMGTEDRVTDPLKKVDPSSGVLPFVTFPGTEIKDLWVHSPAETKEQPAAPVPTPPTAPAAPVQPVAAPVAAPSAPAPAPAPAPKSREVSNEAHAKPSSDRHRRQERSLPGTGSHLTHLRTRGGRGDVELGEDFDFAASIANFDKGEVSKLSEGVNSSAGLTAYKKDDFFDAISSDVMESGPGARRLAGEEERRLNQETFGATALQSNFRGRGRGRGRRGGRGHHSQEQQQHHNNNNNNQHHHTNNQYNSTNNDGSRQPQRGRGRGRRGGRGRFSEQRAEVPTTSA